MLGLPCVSHDLRTAASLLGTRSRLPPVVDRLPDVGLAAVSGDRGGSYSLFAHPNAAKRPCLPISCNTRDCVLVINRLNRSSFLPEDQPGSGSGHPFVLVDAAQA